MENSLTEQGIHNRTALKIIIYCFLTIFYLIKQYSQVIFFIAGQEMKSKETITVQWAAFDLSASTMLSKSIAK